MIEFGLSKGNLGTLVMLTNTSSDNKFLSCPAIPGLTLLNFVSFKK